MGKKAGVCWGADISDRRKNIKRGIDCITSGHGRVMEWVNIEMDLLGVSARCMREYERHIGGAPSSKERSYFNVISRYLADIALSDVDTDY